MEFLLWSRGGKVMRLLHWYNCFSNTWISHNFLGYENKVFGLNDCTSTYTSSRFHNQTYPSQFIEQITSWTPIIWSSYLKPLISLISSFFTCQSLLIACTSMNNPCQQGSHWHSPRPLCIIIQFDVWFVWDIIKKCYIHPMILSPSNSMYFSSLRNVWQVKRLWWFPTCFFVWGERDICTRNMSWNPL